MNDLFLRLVVLSLKSSLLLSFGEHGGWKVALPLGAIFKHGGSMWIRVLNPLQLVLSPLKENGKLSWVANITVTFEFNADLDGTVSPDIPANAPVERILEGAPVERFDVRFVRL